MPAVAQEGHTCASFTRQRSQAGAEMQQPEAHLPTGTRERRWCVKVNKCRGSGGTTHTRLANAIPSKPPAQHTLLRAALVLRYHTAPPNAPGPRVTMDRTLKPTHGDASVGDAQYERRPGASGSQFKCARLVGANAYRKACKARSERTPRCVCVCVCAQTLDGSCGRLNLVGALSRGGVGWAPL